MVVAVTASVSAMTGTGLATKSVLIDGAKIKNGSITAKKLSSTALAPKGYRLLAAPSSATSRLHTSGTRTSGPYLATICSDGNIVFNQPCPATWTPAPAPVPTPGPAGPSGPDGKLGSAYPVGSIRVVWEFDGVSRPEFPRSIMDFQDRFATEAACRKYLFDCRWPEGFVCPGCGGRRSGQATRRYLWICTACGLQTSVTAGTVMHATRTPLRTWFWSAYLVATHHPGISAKQLQRQLGLTRYETAWVILHKLRRAMVAPERSQLTTEVEVDEFFLGGLEEGLKGGRQRGKKALVGVAVEVRGRGSGRLRLQILPDASASSLGAFVTATTATGTVVHTDGWQGYKRLAALDYQHRPIPRSAIVLGEDLLPRAHRAVSNFKAWMHGTHRGALPFDLNEFVFRHNRRGTPMAAFQTLLGLGTQHAPVTSDEITRRAACSVSWLHGREKRSAEQSSAHERCVVITPRNRCEQGFLAGLSAISGEIGRALGMVARADPGARSPR